LALLWVFGITFWAYSGYRTSAFNTGGGSGNTNYAGSLVRENLMYDFSYVVARWPQINTVLLTKGTTSGGAVASDRIWLPSGYEVEDAGAWNLTAPLRRFSVFGTGSMSFAWLRNADPLMINSVEGVGSDGFHGFSQVTNSNVVRPALHISLEAIQAAAEDGAGGGAVPPGGNGNNNNNNNEDRGVNIAARTVVVSFLVVFAIVLFIIAARKAFGRRRG